VEQNGLCNGCKEPLPDDDAVLDRFEAMNDYTMENTQLLCRRILYSVVLTSGALAVGEWPLCADVSTVSSLSPHQAFDGDRNVTRSAK
jgi:hypothetical protein